jgi:hypothetical protein
MNHMDVICPSCGAENYESARYCRKCGLQLGSSEFHEAPTRELGHERELEVEPDLRKYQTFPSTPLNQGSVPRYVPPPASQMPVPLAGPGATGMPGRVSTSPIQTGPVSKKPKWVLIFGAIILTFFLGAGIIGAIVASAIREVERQEARERAAAEAAPAPRGNVIDADQLPDEVREWYYDGAAIERFVHRNDGPVNFTTLIMNTEDDAQRVAEFYRDAMRDTKGRSEFAKDDKVVMSGAGTNVVINGSGGTGAARGKTRIVVVIGAGVPGLPGGIPGLPEIPDIEDPNIDVPEPPDIDIDPDGAPPAPPPAPPAAAPAKPNKK